MSEDLAVSAVTSEDGEVYNVEVIVVSAGSQEPLTCLAHRHGATSTPTTGGAGNHSPGITLGYRAQCQPGRIPRRTPIIPASSGAYLNGAAALRLFLLALSFCVSYERRRDVKSIANAEEWRGALVTGS